MKCLSPLAASIFADGEAGPAETQAVTQHLAECSRCRQLVDVLRQENIVLTEALGELDRDTAPASVFGSTPARVLLLVSVALLAVRLAWQSFSFETPAELGWLNSMGEGSWWQVLFSLGFYLRDNGTEIVNMITTIALFALILLLFISTTWLMRRRNFGSPVLFALVACILVAPASALERRTGQIVTVPTNETVQDSLVVSADTVNVDGNIAGDLILFCRQATVRGTVQGNIISFSRNVQIEGQIGGSAFTFGQLITLGGQVERNWFAFGQNLLLLSDGRVGSNLIAFGSDIDAQGAITRDLTTFSESASLRGNVGGNFTARGDRVNIADPARIGGNLVAHLHAADRLQVGQGVTIEGKRDVRVRERRSRYATPGFYIFKAGQLAAAWLVGMLLIWLLPSMLISTYESGAALARRIGIGFLVLVVTPVAVVLVAITLIGIPLALIALVLWLIALYLAKIFVAALVGRALLDPIRPGVAGFAVPLFVGLLVLFIAMNVPYLGALVRLGVLVLGLGMAFEWVRRTWPRREPAPLPQPS